MIWKLSVVFLFFFSCTERSVISGPTIVPSIGRSPPPRTSPSIIYAQYDARDSSDTFEAEFYLYGGRDAEEAYFTDLVKYSTSTGWSTLSQGSMSNPPKRISFASYRYGDSLFVWGGRGPDGLSNQLYSYNLQTSQWSIVTQTGKVPDPRQGCAFTTDATYLYVFGGQTQHGFSNELFRMNLDSYEWEQMTSLNKNWTDSSTIALPPVLGAQMFTGQKYLYVVGGLYKIGGTTGVTDVKNLVFYINKTAETDKIYFWNWWDDAGQQASPRYFASYATLTPSSSAASPTDGKFYVYGGKSISSGIPESLPSLLILTTTEPADPVTGKPSIAVVEYAVSDTSPNPFEYNSAFTVVKETTPTSSSARENEGKVVVVGYSFAGGVGSAITGNLLRFEVPASSTPSSPSLSLTLIDFHSDAIPIPRTRHKTSLSRDHLWVFGGIASTADLSSSSPLTAPFSSASLRFMNDLYSYDTTDNKWTKILPEGEKPSPRARFGMAASESRIFVFGGIGAASGNEEGEPLGDLWIYSILYNTWEKLEPAASSSLTPSPRSQCACALAKDAIWVYGGVLESGAITNELWRFSLVTRTWVSCSYVVSSTSTLPEPIPTADPSLSVAGNYLVVLGGHDSAGNAIQRATVLGTPATWSANHKEQVSVTVYVSDAITYDGKAIYPIYPHSATASYGSYLFSFGGMGDYQAESRFTVMNYANVASPVFSIQTEYPVSDTVNASFPFYFDSTATVRGNNIFVFGGSYLSASTPLSTQFTNSLHRYSLTSGCFAPYITSDSQCIPCEAGYYADYDAVSTGTCLPCPVGTFNPYRGGGSMEGACFPCPTGTYSSTTAATQCIACSKNEYCPLGSTLSNQTLATAENDRNLQPAFIEHNDLTPGLVVAITGIAMAVGLVIAVVVLFLENISPSAIIRNTFDCFNGTFVEIHEYPQRGVFSPFYARKEGNRRGLFMTMVFFPVAVFSVIQVVIDYTSNKVLESKSLVLDVMTDIFDYSRLYTKSMQAEIKLIDYSGTCTRDALNFTIAGIIFDTLSYAYSETSSENSYFRNTSVCTISFSAKDVFFNFKGDQLPSINVTSTERGTFAYALQSFLSVDTGIQDSKEVNQVSQLVVFGQPKEGYVYKGVEPTIFKYTLMPTRFNEAGSSLEEGLQYGLQAGGGEVLEGSVADVDDFPISFGFNTHFHFYASERNILTEWQDRESLIVFIVTVLTTFFSEQDTFQLLLSLDACFIIPWFCNTKDRKGTPCCNDPPQEEEDNNEGGGDGNGDDAEDDDNDDEYTSPTSRARSSHPTPRVIHTSPEVPMETGLFADDEL